MDQNSQFLIEEVTDDFVLVMTDQEEQKHEKDKKKKSMKMIDEKSLFPAMDKTVQLILKHSGIYDDDNEQQQQEEEDQKQEFMEQRDSVDLGIYDDEEEHSEDKKQEYMEHMDEKSGYLTMDENLDLILKHSGIYDDEDEEEEQNEEDQRQESTEERDKVKAKVVDVDRLVLNFLGNDNSFFCPWKNKNETTSRFCNMDMMHFPEGSFFANEKV